MAGDRGPIELSDRERLVLVVLGVRYLRFEARPWPMSEAEALRTLKRLEPERGWTEQNLRAVLDGLWCRVARNGPYVTHDPRGGVEVWLHATLSMLLTSAALVAPDLRLLG